MVILSIDPGNETSGVVWYDTSAREVFEAQPKMKNDILISVLDYPGFGGAFDLVAIEDMESYGMPVGKTIFRTAQWSGRFWECGCRAGVGVVFVPRSQVKLTICRNRRANDATIRAAVIDQFGGSRKKAMGTKKRPGPLYGVTSDAMSALAVALTVVQGGEDAVRRVV